MRSPHTSACTWWVACRRVPLCLWEVGRAGGGGWEWVVLRGCACVHGSARTQRRGLVAVCVCVCVCCSPVCVERLPPTAATSVTLRASIGSVVLRALRTPPSSSLKVTFSM